jgi:Abnormal spindle-like microcephaly-assoc'd, ASPM-SPD-2-Hydin
VKIRFFVLVCLLLLVSARLSYAQSNPPNPQTPNTTSACDTSSLVNGCYGYFPGFTDHATPTGSWPPTSAPATNTDTVETVPPASNVSWVPFSALYYPGYSGSISTKMDCHFQGWFGGGGPPPGTSGSSHDAIGMDQSQTAVVNAQIQNAINRGCNYVDFDWYGSGNTFIDSVTLAWIGALDTLCSQNSGVCPLQMALMEDGNTTSGRSTSGFETDMTYASTHYFTHPSYWKMNVNGCSNRPVVLAFGWSVFSSTDWATVQTYDKNNIGNCNNQPLIATDGANGLNETNLDGGYAWINVTAYTNASPGTVTTPGVSGTVQFDTHFQTALASWYGSAITSTKPVRIGAIWAGFNDTNANWGFASPHTEGRKMSRECGRVWVNSYGQLTAPNHFTSTNQIPFMGIPTWNDYEEGTAIEPGIDNCLTESSFAANVNTSNNTVNWSYSFGTSSYAHVPGDVSTIHHYALWDGTNGNWTQVSTNNVGMTGVSCSGTQNVSCSAPLSGYTWSPGIHTLYVQAVGQPSISNHVSPSVSFDAEPIASVSPASITFPNTNVTSTSSATVTVTNTGNAALVIPQNGATITSGSGTFNINPNPYPTCTAQANGGSCVITVTFTPPGCITYNGTLSITDNASGSPQQVSLSGTGTSPGGCIGGASKITPNPYPFGNVPAGTQSTTAPFSFLNETGGTITPTLAVPSSFLIVSNTCSNVANNTSCNIGVACSPTTAGSYGGSLTASYGGSVIASSTLSCTGTSTNQGTVLFSQIQNMSGWTYCADGTNSCGGGNGTGTASWTPNISSPSEPNVLNPSQTEPSADYTLGGTGSYSNARFYIQLGAQDSVTQFTYNVDLYIDKPSTPQAIVFSLGQAVSNTYYPFQFQCDFKGTGKWNVYNPANGSWNSTGVTCSTFAANTWTHLSFSMNTTGGTLNYTGISVGGTAHTLTGVSGYHPTTYSPDAIISQIYLDGDSTQDSFNLYLDNVVLYDAANLQPNASFSPATLDLGTTTTGSATAVRDLTLTNSGTGALSISSVSTNNSQFVISSNNCGASLAANSSCIVGLSFAPTSGSYGTANGLVTVTGGETITANVIGTNLNPNTILYSNMQNDAWIVCNTVSCVGGNGSATSTYAANQSTPTINGQNSGLAQFSASSGSSYSNSKFKDAKAAQDSYSVFQLNVDVYISDPTKPQNLQFVVAQADAGKYYAFQFMCDLKAGGIWRIWNLGAGSWVATSIPCTSSSFAKADWTHLTFTVQRTSGSQMQYLSLAVGGNTYTINSSLYNPASQSPDDIEALLFESGDGSDEGYSIYLSNVTISHQ